MEKQFTGKDHVAAVLGNGQTDRIPVRAMQGFRPILELAGVTGKEINTQPDKYVKALATVNEVFPMDVIATLVGDPALSAEIAGISLKELKAFAPGETVLKDKTTLSKLKVRDANEYERLAYVKEICETATKALPDVVLDAVTLSPWSTAMIMRGMEATIYDSVDDPDFVHALLRFTTDLSKVIGDAVLETGVGMLTLGDPSAGCSVLSPSMFRNWAKPYLLETISHFKKQNKAPIFLHICGYVDPIMEDLVSLGVDGLSIDAPSSLKKMVEISQKRIVIEGNFPGELYFQGTREQIEEKVKESVEIAAEPNGYRYILCSGCQVPDNAPLENVRIFLDAGKHYGRHAEG